MSRTVLLCMFAVSLCVTACRHGQTQSKPAEAEPGISAVSSVVFNIAPDPNPEGAIVFDGTYTSRSKVARFRINLGVPGPVTPVGGMKLRSGEGTFESVPGSDASVLIADLKKALEAKHLPSSVKRARKLAFNYTILGENQSLRDGGGFNDKPTGDWTAMKIFLTSADGDDDNEVFLNFNLKDRIAEFTEKDPDYGDAVVAILATVL